MGIHANGNLGGIMKFKIQSSGYTLIDRDITCKFLGIEKDEKLPEYQELWVDEIIKNNGLNKRDKKWTESIAVGEIDFVLKTKSKLGAKGIGRKVIENKVGFELKRSSRNLTTLFLRLKTCRLAKITPIFGRLCLKLQNVDLVRQGFSMPFLI